LGLPEWVDQAVVNSWVIIILLAAFAYLGTRRLALYPRRSQNFLEFVVESLNNLTAGVIGPEGKGYTPFIATLFIYILVMNLFGLLPGFMSPTASLNTTVALALVVVAVSIHASIKARGFFGYLLHLCGKPLWLAPIMFPTHLMGELFSRPLSLSVRLFCNIFGEDMIIAQFALLIPLLLGFIPIPIQLPVMLLALLTSFVQALVFSLLASVYLAGALAKEEH